MNLQVFDVLPLSSNGEALDSFYTCPSCLHDSPRCFEWLVLEYKKNHVSYSFQIAKPESQQHDKYIGRYAQANEDLLDTITRPISRGAITDWDAMDDLWNHMYYEELLVPPEQFPILHTEMVENSMSSREKHIEV